MKDLLFNIYRYDIVKEKYQQLDMFKETSFRSNDSDIDYFEKKCLGNKGSKIILREFIVYQGPDRALNHTSVETREKKDHVSNIVEHRDDIIIINVDSKKKKMLFDENFIETPHENHQPFLIIIDNRPNHQYVAIQQGVIKTDKAAKFLIDTFNNDMLDRATKFDIQKLSKTMSFHDTIFHMKERLGKSITKIAFEFDKKESTTHKLPEAVEHFLKEWIGLFADEGKIVTSISNDEKLKAQEVVRDLEMLGRVCMENAKYKLSAWFGNFGVYRYGKEIGAQFGMNRKVIEDFVNPQEPKNVEQNFLPEQDEADKLPSLEEWLDKVKVAFDDYEKTSLSISGRIRKNKGFL